MNIREDLVGNWIFNSYLLGVECLGYGVGQFISRKDGYHSLAASREMWIGLFTVRAERGSSGCVCPGSGRAGASHAARLSAFQHASGLGPRAARSPRYPHGIICFCATVFVVRRRCRIVFCSRSSRSSSFISLASRISSLTCESKANEISTANVANRVRNYEFPFMKYWWSCIFELIEDYRDIHVIIK